MQEVVCQSIYKSNQLALVGFVVVVPVVIIEIISVCKFSCTVAISEFCSLVSYMYQSAGYAFLKSMAVSSMSVEGFCQLLGVVPVLCALGCFSALPENCHRYSVCHSWCFLFFW